MPANEPMKVSQHGTVEMEGVADDDAGEQLDQRDRESDLDGDHRGEEDRPARSAATAMSLTALPPGYELQLVEAIGCEEQRLDGSLTPRSADTLQTRIALVRFPVAYGPPQ